MLEQHSTSDAAGKSTWIIVGAGAQGRVVAQFLRDSAPEVEVEFVDDEPSGRKSAECGAAVHDRSWFMQYGRALPHALVIALGDNQIRRRVADEFATMGACFGVAKHRTSVVLPSARVASGAMLHPLCFVGADAQVGPHAILNTGAIIEHDCVVGAAASVSPGVKMAGRVRLGDEVFIGAGAVLIPRVCIGAGAVIGAGSVVTRDIPPGVVALGCPARIVRDADARRDWSRIL